MSSQICIKFEQKFLIVLRIKRSCAPSFPITICERNLDLASEYLTSLNYSGPVGLSCDDTKLHPSLRTYLDASSGCHFLVGTTGKPIAVRDEGLLRDLVAESNKDATTKVMPVYYHQKNDLFQPCNFQIRLWCLQIPMPGIPPLILAAKAIPNSLTAQQLLPLSFSLIRGLVHRKIKVVSYACDGTETERSAQKLMVQNAGFRYTYRIKHPIFDLGLGYDDIVITVATIDGQLIVMIQDSNHGLKTSRNNLHTGAKCLTLGNHVAMYMYNRTAAFEKGCPLYHRDVKKTDRQDDNAAIRTHSGSYIAYLTKFHPDKLGQIIYLFINGELIDAYQNRKIPHTERIKMVLRAKFFYQMWKKFLKSAGYAEDKHYVSPVCRYH